jgi:hypothetical protein
MRHDSPQRSHQRRAFARRSRVPNAIDDIPERLAELQSMPRQELVVRSKDGNVVYTYADPDACRCGCGGRTRTPGTSTSPPMRKIATDRA